MGRYSLIHVEFATALVQAVPSHVDAADLLTGLLQLVQPLSEYSPGLELMGSVAPGNDHLAV